MAGPWLLSKIQRCDQCKSLSVCWAKGMEVSSVWWHFHLVKSSAPGSPQWQLCVHSGEKQNKVGERQQLLVVTHYKGTGNSSICRTLSGNYTPSTGLLNSRLSASLQDVTRMQRANISFSDSRSHKKLQGDWNYNGDLTPQGGDRERRTQCALCRRNSLMKNPGSWKQKEIKCISELRIACVSVLLVSLPCSPYCQTPYSFSENHCSEYPGHACTENVNI